MKLPSAKLLAGVPISAERNTIEYAMQKGIEIYYAKGWEMPPANKGERR